MVSQSSFRRSRQTLPQADCLWNANRIEDRLADRDNAAVIHGMKMYPGSHDEHCLSARMVPILLTKCFRRLDFFQSLAPLAQEHEIPGNQIVMDLTKNSKVGIKIVPLEQDGKTVGPAPARFPILRRK